MSTVGILALHHLGLGESHLSVNADCRILKIRLAKQDRGCPISCTISLDEGHLRRAAKGDDVTVAPASVSPARFSAQIRSQALQTRIMELILERGLDVGDALPT